MPRTLRLALISLGCLAYALVFGELFLRLLDPQPLVPRFVTGGRDGIRANLPGVAFRQWTPEVDVVVRYNAEGMRDDRAPPPLRKRPGECRVALLGDSYFVGFESDFAHSFGKRLEDDLAQAGTPARVLNFAVSGFGTAEMLVAMRSRVAQWQPDVIIQSWHYSDLADNVRAGLFTVDGATTGTDVRLLPTGTPFVPGVEISDRLMRVPGYRWLIENSHLYSAVRERAGTGLKTFLAELRGQKPAADDINALAPVSAPPMLDDPLDVFIPDRAPGMGNPLLDRALVYASRDTAAAIGAHFLLYEVPTSGARTRLTPVLPLLGPLGGIVTATPLPDFEAVASPDVKLYYERGHHHWTDLANGIAARAAALALARQGWLQACSGGNTSAAPARAQR